MDTDSDSSSSSEDELDPIVKRLPVYYTPHYLSSLTLLQYPDRPPRPDTRHPLLPPTLRPDHDPAPDPTRSKLAAKYKPHTQHLELQIPIERAAERYNEEQAKLFAQGVLEEEGAGDEGTGKKRKKSKQQVHEEAEERARKEEEKERRRLDHITYSASSVPDVTNYLVGIVKDDALHLSPITQTYQLRPSLTYLDNLITLERRRKRDQKDQDDDDDEGDLSDAEIKKEEAKAVQVSVKQSAEGAAAALKPGAGGLSNGRAGASLFAPLRAEEGEAWIPLTHYHADTPQAEVALERMFVSDDGASVRLASTTKPSEYLGITK
ncbi:DNA-directed RNA polymerase III subunit Rpc5 [Leucosporidium creatinivorum]|uniref:DNA-directed RNA polymerase III subunit Rpc5 n=1 Tax=Leucosporidium creatinivorum TaxID=106004 RepID=A0A1Y2EQF5_9BASI|nr:DNA-directed RNA polymerase III subunit Rpc5 [Leucosporidium creatinivorum]